MAQKKGSLGFIIRSNLLMITVLALLSSCTLISPDDIDNAGKKEMILSDKPQNEILTSPTDVELIISSTITPEPTPTRLDQAYLDIPYLRGMNFGNALDAPQPGDWGVTIKPHFYQTLRGAGFNIVRIPVRFSAHTGPSPDYLIDEEILLLSDQVIYWGLDNGFTVILDLHHFEELMQTPSKEFNRFIAIWEQLANHYQHAPSGLYFELLNEPSKNLDALRWNLLMEAGIRVIRKTNPTRKIVIGGVNYSDIESLFLLNLPEDQNLIATFHFYKPFELTHQGASWVEGSSKWLNTQWLGTDHEQLAIINALDMAVNWSNENQISLIMGEFGVINNADLQSRINWIKFVVEQAEKRQISWIYWEFCSHFGVYDCEQDQWNRELLKALFE